MTDGSLGWSRLGGTRGINKLKRKSPRRVATENSTDKIYIASLRGLRSYFNFTHGFRSATPEATKCRPLQGLKEQNNHWRKK